MDRPSDTTSGHHSTRTRERSPLRFDQKIMTPGFPMRPINKPLAARLPDLALRPELRHTDNFGHSDEGGRHMASKFEIQSPKAGQFRWVLVSQGRTLAKSPTYTRRALAQKSIDSFRMAAIAAPVTDLTVPVAETTPGKVARVVGRTAGRMARMVKNAG